MFKFTHFYENFHAELSESSENLKAEHRQKLFNKFG